MFRENNPFILHTVFKLHNSWFEKPSIVEWKYRELWGCWDCPPVWQDTRQILLFYGGRDNVVLLLSEPFDVLFPLTLERPLCHINQGHSEYQAVFSVNPEASAYTDNDLLGKKSAIFVAATFSSPPPADVS